MSVMHAVRKGRPAAALPVIAGLAAIGLALAPAAQAVNTVPARPAAAGLHVTGKVDLGRLGSSFSYVFTEAPDGNVYYAKGSVVYVVKGDHAPVVTLRASGPVLAAAATSSDLLVEVGSKVSAYALSNGHRLRTWALPSAAPVTSAGLFPVGSTVWAFTDWATDQSGFEYANVDRFSLSSPTIHRVSANDVYPADMAANSAGLYYEGIARLGQLPLPGPALRVAPQARGRQRRRTPGAVGRQRIPAGYPREPGRPHLPRRVPRRNAESRFLPAALRQ